MGEKYLSGFVSLIGSPNAGKSTFLNSVSDAGVLAEDKLFATLDPVVRQITLPDCFRARSDDAQSYTRRDDSQDVSDCFYRYSRCDDA